MVPNGQVYHIELEDCYIQACKHIYVDYVCYHCRLTQIHVSE